MPQANHPGVDQRGVDPLTELATAHGCNGAVEDSEQRALLAATLDGGGQLEIAPGCLIENHEVLVMIGTQGLDMRHRALLGLAEIVQHRARSPNRPDKALTAKSIERGAGIKIANQALGPIGFANPFGYRINHACAQLRCQRLAQQLPILTIRNQHLTGCQRGQFAADTLESVGFGHPEFTGGDIENGHPPAIFC